MSDPKPAAEAAPGPGAAAAPQQPARELRVLGPDDRARKRERIVDVLWSLQEKRGWIDDEAVRIAAAECDLTPQEADEVATFYNLLLRRPAGRTKIFVCDSISCELRGASELIRQLSAALRIKLGEVSADGEFTLLPIVCLGHCELAPCLLAGETIHGPCAVDRASVDTLISRIRDGRSPSPR